MGKYKDLILEMLTEETVTKTDYMRLYMDLDHPENKHYEPINDKIRIQSNYDDIMMPSEHMYYLSWKEALGKLVYIKPMEYFKLCAKAHQCSADEELSSISKDTAKKYADLMEKGEKFPIPYVNMKLHGQEGRHRAYASYLLGDKYIPCIIIEDVSKEDNAIGKFIGVEDGWRISGGMENVIVNPKGEVVATVSQRDGIGTLEAYKKALRKYKKWFYEWYKNFVFCTTFYLTFSQKRVE